jgi:hypothetical protein
MTAILLPLNFVAFTMLVFTFWFSDQAVRNSTVPCIIVGYWLLRFAVSRYGEQFPIIGERLRPILLHNRRVDGLARIEPQTSPMHLDKI